NFLPSEITVSSDPALTNTCGGTVFAPPGARTIVGNGFTLDSNRICTISLNVTASEHGLWTNPVVPLWTRETGFGASAELASLAVAGAPVAATGAARNRTTHSVQLN